jgi:F0F1-type ATP synthase membrane subunit b/b'
LTSDLVAELAAYWGSLFIAAAAVFIICMSLIVWWLSKQITEPIVKLTEKIVLNIKSVQRMKRDTEANQQNKQISF